MLRVTAMVLVFAAGLVGQVLPTGFPQPLRAADVVYRIGVENPVAPSGSPIYLGMIVRNLLDRAGTISNLKWVPTLELTIRDESGEELAKSPWYRDWATNLTYFSGDTLHDLQRGDFVTEQVDLTKFFNLGKPGKYSVQTKRWVGEARGNAGWVLSNTTHFEVVASDKPVLRPDPADGIRTMTGIHPDVVPPRNELPLNLERLRVTLHEPVFAEIPLRAIGDKPVRIQTDDHQGSPYRVSVRYPDGSRSEVFRVKPLPVSVATGMNFEVEVNPGQTRAHRVLLNRWVEFDQEGTYDVAVFLPESMRPARYEVTVGPRDPEALEAAANKLSGSFGAEGLNQAALASMGEDVALRALLRSGDLVAIEALMQMETPASVAAVVELLGKLNAQVASYVQRRLQELAAQTKNVAVRETIERLGLAAR